MRERSGNLYKVVIRNGMADVVPQTDGATQDREVFA